MKRFFLYATCFALPIFGSFAEEPVQSEIIPATENSQPLLQPLNIKIDGLSDEQKQAGLTVEMLQEIILNELESSNIPVNENLSQPYLSLKVRSIQVGLDMATFFQLGFFEQSMLVRNRAMFTATTWSQTALLSCPPEKLKKEILETIGVMAQNFSREYIKALQPAQ